MWYINALRSWWILIVLITLLAAATTLLPQANTYRSEASLLFKFGREYLYSPDIGDGGAMSASRVDLRNAINAEAKIFDSTQVLQQALQDIGIENVLDPDTSVENATPERIALEILRNNFSLRMIENSTVMQLFFVHEDPQVASTSLDAIIKAFLNKRKEIYEDSSLPLIARKLEEVSSELQDAENRLQVFNKENDIYSIDEQQELLMKMKLNATNDYVDAQTDEKQYRASLTLLESRLNNTPDTIELFAEREANRQVLEARNKLFELELEKEGLKGRYRESSNKVTQITEEISSIKKYLSTQETYTTGKVRTGRNPLYDKLLTEKLELQGKLDSVRASQPILQENIAEADRNLREIDQIRGRQRSIVTDFDVLKDRYKYYAEQLDRAQLAKENIAESRANARLIQSPTTPIKAIGLSQTMRTVLATLIGALFAVGVAFFLEWLRSNKRHSRQRDRLSTERRRRRFFEDHYSAQGTPDARSTSIMEGPRESSQRESSQRESSQREISQREISQREPSQRDDRPDRSNNTIPIVARIER